MHTTGPGSEAEAVESRLPLAHWPPLAALLLLLVAAAPAVAAPTIGTGSCTGSLACAGVPDSVTIGDNACNGASACENMQFDVGNDSCNGDSACQDYEAGRTGPIGNDSCNGQFACRTVVAGASSGSVGNASCNGEQACDTETAGSSGSVGNQSCSGYRACFTNFGVVSGNVGDLSCNGAENCANYAGPRPDIGNCERNDASPEACFEEILGNPVVGTGDDSTGNPGDIIFDEDTGRIAIRGRVVEWSFFDDDDFQPDRVITPMILREVEGTYHVSGIGKTRTTTEGGLQTYPFELVSGHDWVQGNGQFFFGFRHGTADGSVINLGVVDADFSGNTTRYFVLGNDPSPVGSLGPFFTATFAATYSYGATVLSGDVGNPVVPTDQDSTGNPGDIIIDEDTGLIRVAGRLTLWTFWDDDDFEPDRVVTPMIFRKIGDVYHVTGIGRARTTTEAGLQGYRFDLQSGSDQVLGDGSYFFGFRHGTADGSVINLGVVDAVFSGNTTRYFVLGTEASPVGSLGAFFNAEFSATYSYSGYVEAAISASGFETP